MRIPRSNVALVAAIITSFREEPALAHAALQRFSSSEWIRTETWLDTSGLALYFLKHAGSLGIASAIDPAVRHRLEMRLNLNIQRTAEMMAEFSSLNDAFQQAGFIYANLKGFTLIPDSCLDPTLRHQSDYDFLIAPDDLDAARDLLLDRGYLVAGSTARTLELKKDATQIVSIEGQYQSLCHRSIELHTSLHKSHSPGCDPRLDRLSLWHCNGYSYPALSSPDQFVCQALHLLGHLRHEHTKVSWMLEYHRHAHVRRHDQAFWESVASLANEAEDGLLALSLVSRITGNLFGEFLPSSIATWTQSSLPPGAALWAQHFGTKSVLADAPGTKLYLFLESVIDKSSGNKLRLSRRLLPFHLPQRIPNSSENKVARRKLRRSIFWFRLRFHFKQNALYLLYLPVWHLLTRKDERKLASQRSFNTPVTSPQPNCIFDMVRQDNKTKTLL